MKTNRRILSLLLALLMVGTALCLPGCGSEKTDDSGKTDPVIDTPVTPDEPDTEDEPDTPAEPDEPDETDEDDETDETVETVTCRFDSSKFHIGVYNMGPKTLENAEWLKKLGVDMIIDSGFTEEILDYFDKNDMGVIQSGVLPGWWGDGGQNAGNLQYNNSLESYAANCANITDHPAVWGVDCGDEPNALDFPYYGQIIETVTENAPQVLPYVNLYPGYASNQLNSEESYSQLGTDTFEEYIRSYAANVNTDYICYDNYPFGSNNSAVSNFTVWYSDLDTVSTVCRETGRDMWIVIQVNNDDNGAHSHLNKYQLQFQAYQAMAFGAKVITWACYYPGWWYNNVLNSDGTQGVMYDILRAVNKNIKGIAKTYEKYDNVATHFVGFTADSTALFGESVSNPNPQHVLEDAVNTTVFKNVKPAAGQEMVIGEMVSNGDDGSTALMVADASYRTTPVTGTYEMTFTVEGDYVITLYKGTKSTVLTPSADGLYHVSVEYCDGFLLTATLN